LNILITGPESSGKTILSKQLSHQFNVPFIEEYARTYLEINGPQYKYADLLRIAKGHKKQTKAKSSLQAKHLIFDTYLLNIKIWSQVKFGNCHQWILEELEKVKWDCVLLLKPTIKWEPGPFRESQHTRNCLFNIFEKELQSLEQAYYIIDKIDELRYFQAQSICRRYLR